MDATMKTRLQLSVSCKEDRLTNTERTHEETAGCRCTCWECDPTLTSAPCFMKTQRCLSTLFMWTLMSAAGRLSVVQNIQCFFTESVKFPGKTSTVK